VRISLYIVGVVLLLLGVLWFLQGINILPGSFMTGQIKWAIYGGIIAVLGVVLIIAANRKRSVG
jgi:hypothetical protein